MPNFANAPIFADLTNLAVALAIGFLIGFEREHAYRVEGRLHSFAGARTFSLVALAGGVSGLIAEGWALPIAVFLAIAALTVAAHWATAREQPGAGGTTEVALLLAFILGLAAVRGHILTAAIAGVITAIILSIKARVQHWAAVLTEGELFAALRLLAISVIILPVLPDEAFGPYDALNLRDIWLMVVFISGLSFLGYWLIKLTGAGRGILLTGFAGGLASSTATTLSLSRFTKKGADASALAAGIVAANVMMIIRIGFLVTAIAREALVALAPGLIAAAFAGTVGLMWLRRRDGSKQSETMLALGNPMEIRPALFFAALLAAMSLAAAYAGAQFGQSGLLAVASLSGLADVDAITLIAGRQASSGAIAMSAAAEAIMAAAATNIVLKAAMAWSVGGRALGLRVGAVFAAMIAAGAAGLMFF